MCIFSSLFFPLFFLLFCTAFWMEWSHFFKWVWLLLLKGYTIRSFFIIPTRVGTYIKDSSPPDFSLAHLLSRKREESAAAENRESLVTSACVWKVSRCLTRSLSRSFSRPFYWTLLCLSCRRGFASLVHLLFVLSHPFFLELHGFCPSFKVCKTFSRSLEHLRRILGHLRLRSIFLPWFGARDYH